MNILKDHLDFFCKAIGLDIEAFLKPVESRQINPSLIDVENSLLKVYNLLNTQKDGLALHVLASASEDIFEILKRQDRAWFTANFEVFKDALNRVEDLRIQHELWLNGEFTAYLKTYEKYDFFKPDELTVDNISPDLIIALEETEFSDLIKSFQYKVGKPVPVIPENIEFRVSENLYIIETFENFFSFLKNNKLDENTLHVHFIMKIEEREDLSHFLISFSYQGNVWFVSDLSTEFENPLNKATTRNPFRRREKYYKSLEFPYYLIDELETIRKQGKNLVKFGENGIRLFTKKINELPVTQKLFFISLVQKSIPSLPSYKTTLLTLSEYLDQKLISSGENSIQYESNDAEGFVGWEDHIAEISNDLIDSTKSESSTDLVLISKDLIVKNPLFDKDWLGTPEQLEVVTKWMAFDSKAKDLKIRLERKKRAYERDLNKLDELLNAPENLTHIWKFLFSGDDVYTLIEDGLTKEGPYGFGQVKTPKCFHLKYHSTIKRLFSAFNLGMSRSGIETRVREYRTSLFLRQKYSERSFVYSPVCTCCNKVKAANQFDLNVEHYSQLMILTGVTDRNKLPEYYRYFRGTQLIPYHGNSILDNVHPFAMLKHPSWEKYGNGIFIRVYLCKRCVNSLSKQYRIAPKTVILPDLTIRAKTDQDDVTEYYWG